MRPLAYEHVQQEITTRLEEADRLRHRQVERAAYEVDRARHRSLQVDPANRLVASSLEADWNAKLRALAEAPPMTADERHALLLILAIGVLAQLLADGAAPARGLSVGVGRPMG